MKLASLKHGRDGRLVVVSRDLTRAADASAVAPTLREALDDWAQAVPRLTEIADALEAGRIAHVPFDPKQCAAPLPRAFGWADGSAYVNHVALVRQARGAEVPATFWTDPLMYQGGSDSFIGATDPVALADEAWGIDLEAEVAVILGDVPMAHAARAGRAAHQASHAGQRRQPAQPDPGRTRQGLRLPPGQAVDRVLAGRGDAGRAGFGLGRRQGQPAAAVRRSTASRSAGPTPAST